MKSVLASHNNNNNKNNTAQSPYTSSHHSPLVPSTKVILEGWKISRVISRRTLSLPHLGNLSPHLLCVWFCRSKKKGEQKPTQSWLRVGVRLYKIGFTCQQQGLATFSCVSIMAVAILPKAKCGCCLSNLTTKSIFGHENWPIQHEDAPGTALTQSLLTGPQRNCDRKVTPHSYEERRTIWTQQDIGIYRACRVCAVLQASVCHPHTQINSIVSHAASMRSSPRASNR